MKPGHSRGPAQAGIRVGSPAAVPVIVADARWYRAVPGAVAIVRRAAAAAGGAQSVVLGSDALVRALNWQHRGRNKPTNVLTFEATEHNPGEIILALGVVRREAAAAGRRPWQHLAHLVVHGALHVRGLDHHRAGDARRMEMAETRILHRMRVPNPWRVGR